MRESVLDTETTGFDPDSGDRIVEIGAVELERHVPTGRPYHQYINPERSMPQEAFEVHGLGDEFLASIEIEALDFHRRPRCSIAHWNGGLQHGVGADFPQRADCPAQ